MWINNMKVTGDYGFEYNFKETNILLGENGNGKTTFIKLLLYGLGAKISSFVDEISKFNFCDYVYLDVTTKSNNKFLVIRKLPYVDNVSIMPISKENELLSDEIRILNLSEYSDFLLEEEHYSKNIITYSGNKTATLTYRLLLRTAIVDQFTPHKKILADISGDKNEFINNQQLLNNAIIEKVLNTLDQDLQTLRLEYKQKEKERTEINSKISFYKDVQKEHPSFDHSTARKAEQLVKEIQTIKYEKEKLSIFKYEEIKKIESANNEITQDAINSLRVDIKGNESRITHLSFENKDLSNLLKAFQAELQKVKKQLKAHEIINNIPVTICPVCFSEIHDLGDNGLCPNCNTSRKAQEKIDDIALYKRSLDENIIEVNVLIEGNKSTIIDLKKQNRNLSRQLEKIESEYLDKINNVKNSISHIVNEIQIRNEYLTKKEYSLQEYCNILIKLNKLKSAKDSIDISIKQLREDVQEAEKKSADEMMLFMKFEEYNQKIFNEIFGEKHEISISKEDYMPIIDGTSITNSSHSESIKVVAHLSYILSIFLLNEYLEKDRINNLQFVIFDSPRDKDLDLDKYQKYLSIIAKHTQGQIFLTGSSKDIDVYEKCFDKKYFLDVLSNDSKILKRIKK
ncbi:MAG TPA: hypothetical protein VHO94_03275 [Oscillospiraceae bacterium]|nr:hypothetical protein [Oscillospiraceae bacterium]